MPTAASAERMSPAFSALSRSPSARCSSLAIFSMSESASHASITFLVGVAAINSAVWALCRFSANSDTPKDVAIFLLAPSCITAASISGLRG